MLGFFRRYEKTFLLVIFAPALLSLGITGAMISVLQNPGDQVAGHMFGEEVTRGRFDHARRLYSGVNRVNDDESVWRFMAYHEAARRAGIDVSAEEVGEEIRSTFKWDIARYKAEQALQEKGVDIGTPEGKKQFRTEIFRYLQQGTEFDPELYEEILDQRYRGGLGVAAFEEQKMRAARVTRLLDLYRELAVVGPDEVREKFVEQRHRRVAELLEVPAELYTPDLEVTDPDDPRRVSDEEVRAYYEDNQADFDVPRRVDVEYVAFPVEAAKFEDAVVAPANDPEEQRAYFEEQYVATGVAPVGSFTALQDQVRGELLDLRARRRVDRVMNAVADRVARAEENGRRPDLAAYRDAVQEELGCQELIFGSTGLVTKEELAEHGDIGTDAATRWFEVSYDEDDVSDVLAGRLEHLARNGGSGPEVWFLLRSREIRPARSPKFDEVRDDARRAYAAGSSQEQRRFYEQHKQQRYLRKPGFEVEVLLAHDADFDGDHAAAKAALEQALEVLPAKRRAAAGEEGWGEGFRLAKLTTDPAVESGALEVEDLKVAGVELDEHPILGGVAARIRTTPRLGKLSRQVHERADGEGWMAYRVNAELPQKVKPFEEVEEDVARAVSVQRGLDRAEEAAGELLDRLQGLSGDGLEEVVAEEGLEPIRTEPFGRDATELEGVPAPAAKEIVSAAFSDAAQVGGGYFESVRDAEGEVVYLVRVAEKVDPPEEEFAERYVDLRKDLLSEKKGDFSQRKSRELLLEAKGISLEHVEYAAHVRDGPGDRKSLEVRQLFLPPDQEIVDGWLEEAALERMSEVQEALARGESWQAVVDRFSEDANTRSMGGELPPLSRGDLTQEYGTDFEEAVFDLPLNEASQPIRSKLGFHLVEKVEVRGSGQTVFRQILIKTDPEVRDLPESIVDEARVASRKAVEDALARIEGGEPFALVADEVGSPDDPNARGAPFEVDYVTAVEREALHQPLEWEPGGGGGALEDLGWMPEAVRISGPEGERWHLFACSRKQDDRASARESAAGRPRDAFHIATDSESDMEAVRGELEAWLEDWVDDEGDRPPWMDILERFQAAAREHSVTPDAERGGALGALSLDESIRGYGPEFLRAVTRAEEGGEVEPGYRTGIVESDAGFHIVQVVDVSEVEDPIARRTEVAQAVLDGTGW